MLDRAYDDLGTSCAYRDRKTAPARRHVSTGSRAHPYAWNVPGHAGRPDDAPSTPRPNRF